MTTLEVSSTSNFLKTLLLKKAQTCPSIWFMRQAGRYLPEYRALRSNIKQFLELCYNPEQACEVTLQPIRRFKFDASIVFSDILVIPHALGQGVSFQTGDGPKLDALTNKEDVNRLDITRIEQHLTPVFKTIELCKKHLPSNVPLIGFAGSPWTIATYMLEGGSSKNFLEAKRWAYGKTEWMSLLIDRITEATIIYLKQQINHGANAIQLFDSWAGVLDEQAYMEWVVKPNAVIVKALKAEFPTIPIIGFPNRSGWLYERFAANVPVDGISFDMSVPVEEMRRIAKTYNIVAQGNLDPALLVASKDGTVKRTREIIEGMKDVPFIFNLGHGILPQTPIEHVEALIEAVRSTS